MIEHFKRALILAPHTDDGELGLGGTIHKLSRSGCELYYAAFSTAAQSVPDGFPRDILRSEVKQATRVLGIRPENLRIFDYEVRKLSYVRQEILEQLIVLRQEIRPEIVFMPSLKDVHQDHATTAREGLRAFKNTTLLGYELIWNNLSFDTDCFIEIEEEDLSAKCMALREYKSQGQKRYLSEEFIRSLAIARGIQAGHQFAEAFEVVRLFL